MAQAPFSQAKLDALTNESTGLQNSLDNSSTAFSENTPPTAGDLSLDARLSGVNNTITQLKGQKLREQWYGPSAVASAGDTAAPPSGILSTALDTLAAPLHGIVGGAEWALGKGQDPSLFGSIDKNVTTGHETFGNLLNREGINNRLVTLPLGFALDVAMDPVNWLTAGSEALVPRVAGGFVQAAREGGVEAGLDAAKTGFLSNIEKKAATIMPYLAPVKTAAKVGQYLTENAPEGESALGSMLSNAATKYRGVVDSLGEAAVSGGEHYNALTGKDVLDNLGKDYGGWSDLNAGKTLGTRVEDLVNKIPSFTLPSFLGGHTMNGEDISGFFKYSPTEFNKTAQLEDNVAQLAKNSNVILVNPTEAEAATSEGKPVFKSVDDFLKPGAPVSAEQAVREQFSGALADGARAVKEPALVLDSAENAQKLLEAAGYDYNTKNLLKAYEEVPLKKTGVAWYDDWVDKQKALTVGDMLDKSHLSGLAQKLGIYDKVQDWTPLKRFLDINDGYLKWFKWAKVPANPASLVKNFGAATMFRAMAGLPIEDGRLISADWNALQFLRGKRGADYLFKNFFNDSNSWLDMFDKNPNLFKQVYGLSAKDIPSAALKEMKVWSINKGGVGDINSVKNELQGYWQQLNEGVKSAMEAETGGEDKVTSDIIKRGRKAFPSPIDTLRGMAEKGPIKTTDMPSSWGANELSGNDWFNKIKAQAELNAKTHPNNPLYRLGNLLMNTMPNTYEYSFQGPKLATATYLSNTGLDAQGLHTLSLMTPISKEDVLDPIREGGKSLYRLTPKAATLAASEIHKNYAAMPDFVKVLRALPVVGSPFFSFTAAMLSKTGKTLLHNPSIFNKVEYLLNEASGERGPLEKKALTEKYNSFLNSPTMLRLSSTLNVDLKNLLPYYTMNLINPADRSYNGLPGDVISAIDYSGFAQHPIGQIMMDYFVIPSIIGKAETPQGQFGEPIYPIGSTRGTQAAYGARALAETTVPGALNYLGLANALIKAPAEMTNLIPSYGIRQIANATQGEDTVGAITKEDPVSKTIRALSARSGLPFYPLDTTFLSGKNQKTIKKP